VFFVTKNNLGSQRSRRIHKGHKESLSYARLL
jgi:hypothetical protein